MVGCAGCHLGTQEGGFEAKRAAREPSWAQHAAPLQAVMFPTYGLQVARTRHAVSLQNVRYPIIL
jgi:hypothetical protein